MPIVRLGAGQSNSTGKANVFGKQYGDKYGGLASSVGISIAASRGMQFRVTKTLAKKIVNLWKLITTIPGKEPGDKSGYSVSLSGDGKTLAIGARYNDDNSTDSGHTRIYSYNNVSWNLIKEIHGKAGGDFSGYSVSLSYDGTTLAIGAVGNSIDSGHTQIYSYNNNKWDMIKDIPGEAAQDYSGFSVSLSDDGKTLAIGAIGNDDKGSNSGHTRIYRYYDNVDGSWNQIGGDLDGEAAYDDSGHSVSLSGDGKTLAVGATGNDGDNGNSSNSGHTRIYKLNNGIWNPIKLIPGEAPGDESGHSVSLSYDGNTVAIGAIGNGSGHTRIYSYNDNKWDMIKDIPGEAGDRSGHSVSLSGDGKTLAIGAIGNGSGHTRIYRDNGYKWNMIKEINGEADGDQSGHSVSLSYDGNTVAIGARYNSNEKGEYSGHTRIYKYKY